MIGLDPALEDAAMDLGATYPTTLRRVILPLLGPSLLSAWLTGFIVSFDEVALANFLAGGDPTFPVFLYGQLRFAQRLPVLIAMAVLLMVGDGDPHAASPTGSAHAATVDRARGPRLARAARRVRGGDGRQQAARGDRDLLDGRVERVLVGG